MYNLSKEELAVVIILMVGQLRNCGSDLTKPDPSTVSRRHTTSIPGDGDGSEGHTATPTSVGVHEDDGAWRANISQSVHVTGEVSTYMYEGFSLSTYAPTSSDYDVNSVFTEVGPDTGNEHNDNRKERDELRHVGENPIAWTLMCLSVCSVVTNGLSIVVHRTKAIALATFLIVQSVSDILQACVTTFIQVPVFFPPSDEQRNTTEVPDTTVPFTIIRSLEMTLQRVSLLLGGLICVDRFLLLSNPLQGQSPIQHHSKSAVALVLAFVYATGGFEFYALYMENSRFVADRTATKTIPNASCIDVSCGSSRTSRDVHASTEHTTFLPDTTFNMHFRDIPHYPSTSSEQRTGHDVELTTDATTEVITENYSVWNLEAICQKVALAANILMYLALALMIMLNTATLVSLKTHARKNRKLGFGGLRQRQTLILATMTAVYVTLALPYMSLYLVRNFRIWPEFDIAGKQALLFVIMAKGASIFELLKHISDFVVFVVMSRQFRSCIISAVYCGRRSASSNRTTHRQATPPTGQSTDVSSSV